MPCDEKSMTKEQFLDCWRRQAGFTAEQMRDFGYDAEMTDFGWIVVRGKGKKEA